LIGEGGKATLVGAPDANILAAALEILRKRIAGGTATFLVKVKAHRGEPANEGANILADDDDCFYYHSWRNNVVIASMSGVVCVVCPFADDERLKNIHVDLALLV